MTSINRLSASSRVFGKPVTGRLVETALDITYFVMMTGFVIGLTLIVVFMVRFKTPS